MFHHFHRQFLILPGRTQGSYCSSAALISQSGLHSAALGGIDKSSVKR